jgi:FtsP/CotA-like multicopper oxidase with cupredoxin domain
VRADNLVRSLLKLSVGRRSLLRNGAKLGTLGSLSAAAAACAPAFPKIVVPAQAGVLPTAPGASVGVHSMAHATVLAPGVVPGLPREAPAPTWKARTPAEILTAFDYGRVSTLPSGQTLREYTLIAQEAEIEIANGVTFPAWTYNGSVPGPTIRCTEGDRVRIYFQNGTRHPHTIHLHGVHPAHMDGVFEQVPTGHSYVYEFDAEPWGLFPYHCHTMPIRKHIEKGLYGTFIVDPPTPRESAHELVMVMNGFDTDVDGENEIYTVNGVANYFNEHPIELKVGELVRVYLSNMTEFDLINSFHLHGNMFNLYRSGTSTANPELTDTVMLCQGERSVLEFRYKFPGKFMFHAHQSEFAELGWMGFFDVKA